MISVRTHTRNGRRVKAHSRSVIARKKKAGSLLSKVRKQLEGSLTVHRSQQLTSRATTLQKIKNNANWKLQKKLKAGLRTGGLVMPKIKAPSLSYSELRNFKGTSKQVQDFIKFHGGSVEAFTKNVRFETGRQTDAFVQNRYYKDVKMFRITHEGKTVELKDLQSMRFHAEDIYKTFMRGKKN